MILAAISVAGCLAVGSSSDQILLRDLAPAFPAGTDLPAAPVALAPAPAAERRFDLVELQRIAARLGLPAPEREICVTRPAAPIDPARLIEAMRAALPGARIELLDYSRYPAPEGTIEFSPAALRPASAGALWTGAVRYGGAHRAVIWARVNVSVAARRVVATAPIRAGAIIDASVLRVATREEFPSAEPMPSDVGQVAGMVARRPIRAGDTIRGSWLAPRKAVTRGDTVEVEVRSGGALLRLPGQALASGGTGQTILVLNPTSNRRFAARIEGVGRVAVERASL